MIAQIANNKPVDDDGEVIDFLKFGCVSFGIFVTPAAGSFYYAYVWRTLRYLQYFAFIIPTFSVFCGLFLCHFFLQNVLNLVVIEVRKAYIP